MIFENICKLCEQRSISIAKLEKEVGLGNATIRRWNESSPTVDKVMLVANYFGISVSELIEGKKIE